MYFKERELPVRYLGVPLIARKLSALGCKALLERITARINSWASKKLSFAGRFQLLSSVMFSIQVYWSSMFILPKKIIKTIEHKFNSFLWKGTDQSALGVKVAWHLVCVPKQEGGLGLKRIEDWNKAAILKHIWNIFAQAGSLGFLG